MTTTITLSLEARINTVAVLDTQQGNVGVLRLCTRLADKIDLSEEEKKAIGYTVIRHPSGAEMPAWNKNAQLEPKRVELLGDEARKLREALESCPFLKRSDLKWVEPILASFAACGKQLE